MFECNCCGSCCRVVGRIIATALLQKTEDRLIQEYKEFPYPIQSDGSCSMLLGSKCKIYAMRPLVCNSERVYELFYKGVASKAEAESVHKQGCDKIREWDKNGN
jgi:uncharacterized protein